jgi:hypothetical protein
MGWHGHPLWHDQGSSAVASSQEQRPVGDQATIPGDDSARRLATVLRDKHWSSPWLRRRAHHVPPGQSDQDRGVHGTTAGIEAEQAPAADS